MAPYQAVDKFFVAAVKQTRAPRCYSLELRKQLIHDAVRKNGIPNEAREEYLLFPPSCIKRVLLKDKVTQVLACRCLICGSVGGRDLLTDNTLIDAVTTEKGDEQRVLFAVLLYMGAGFAARHVCSFHTRGLEIASQAESLQLELFEPLENAAGTLFSGAATVTARFTTIFEKAWRLFASPKLELAGHQWNLSGLNLPFLYETPLKGEKSSFGRLFAFRIHPEFRGETWQKSGSLPVNPFSLQHNRLRIAKAPS
jgi:hypothetical protein